MAQKKTLSAKEVLKDIKGGMTDVELMEKYRLSTKSLQILFKKLVAAGLITESELDARSSLSVEVIEITEEDAKQESPRVDEARSPVKARKRINYSLNPLILKAAATGQVEETRRLLSDGADPNAKDKDGVTALMFAAKSAHSDVVRLLLVSGADVTLKNKHGDTPLLLATREGHAETVKVILEAGGDPDTAAQNGCTALWIAAVRDYPEIAEQLLTTGATVDGRTQGGSTPLMKAANKGHAKTVTVLLNHGASVNAREHNGRTPLMYAVTSGHIEIVRLLLEMGADVHAKDNEGATALMEAAIWGYTDIARLLLDAGADYDTQITGVSRFRDRSGITPLMAACMKGHADVVKLLLERGVDVNLRGGLGQSALTWAKDKGHADVVRLLESAGAVESAGRSILSQFKRHRVKTAILVATITTISITILLLLTSKPSGVSKWGAEVPTCAAIRASLEKETYIHINRETKEIMIQGRLLKASRSCETDYNTIYCFPCEDVLSNSYFQISVSKEDVHHYWSNHWYGVIYDCGCPQAIYEMFD